MYLACCKELSHDFLETCPRNDSFELVDLQTKLQEVCIHILLEHTMCLAAY